MNEVQRIKMFLNNKQYWFYLKKTLYNDFRLQLANGIVYDKNGKTLLKKKLNNANIICLFMNNKEFFECFLLKNAHVLYKNKVFKLYFKTKTEQIKKYLIVANYNYINNIKVEVFHITNIKSVRKRK